jgi:hypothetical protein
LLKASAPGEKYTSPRNQFSVKIPKPTNWARAPFVIQEDAQHPDYDMVAFYVKDFGEVLIASVRRIPEKVLIEMAKDDNRTVLSNVAYKVLYDWRSNFPEEPKVESENFLQTAYGEAILRVYLAKKGSLLEIIKGGTGKREPEPFDTFIAVMLVKKDNRLIYAIAENDNLTEGGKNKGELQRTIQDFFSGIVVSQ